MGEDREFELKLSVDGATAQALRERRLQRLGAETSGRQTLTATYFDTKKFSLRKRGISLRVRNEGNRCIQTLKGPSRGGAVFDRLEWNVEVERDRPDLRGIEATPFRDMLSAERLERRLRPVFTAEVERTTWHVRSDAAEIELALDEGRIVADSATEDVAELELELKSGSPSGLFTLVRALSPAGSFRIGVLTKAERGYALASGAFSAAAVKAEPLSLQPTMTAADAFRAIVGACLRHFRLNEDLLLATRSAEALHQSRVALRRLRSALSLFKDLVADDEIGKLKSGLRRIWQRLGDARDLDVVLVDLRGAGEAPAANEPGKAEFIARMQADREQAYDRVTAALQDVRFRRLLLDLLAWSETGPWLTADDPDRQARRSEPLDSFAAGVLARQRRKVRRRGQHLGELDVADRHRVRIEAKKLRYATEFFSTLAATKKARRRHETFLKSLQDLQEHLGRLNDLATGEQMAQQQPEDLAARSTEAMRPDGREPAPPDNRDVETSLAAATDAFRDFANAKRFWQEPDAPGKERHTSRE